MEKFESTVLRSIPLTKDVYQIDFKWGAHALPFEAGQFFLLEVEDNQPKVTRAFSLASPPSNKEFFSLCLKYLQGGRASEYLNALKPGDTVHFQGPFGQFTMKASQKDIVMVATGTGIAPFMSILPTLFEQGEKRQITLYFGLRYEEDIFYEEQLRNWEKEHPNFKVFLTISRPSESWTGLKGRVTERLESLDPQNIQVYICGNGDMVKSILDLLQQKGVLKEDIHHELFTPIK